MEIQIGSCHYRSRAYDLYRRPIYSLAILADDDSNWRPDRFEYGVWGSNTIMYFPMVKLLDYANRPDYLAKSRSPFAIATLAMLKAHETQGDAVTRFEWKTHLVEMLYARGWKQKDREELLAFIDLVMALPSKLEERYEADLSERIRAMKQVAPPMLRYTEKRCKKIGKDIGALDNKRESVMRILQRKFSPLTADVASRIEQLQKGELDRMFDAALTANSLAEMPLFEQ